MPRAVRVLLVEDNPADAELVKGLAKRSSSYRLNLCRRATLATAVQELRASEFDLVLLDLDLPDSRGIQTYETVQAADPETPIVVITGYDDIDASSCIVRTGGMGYILKSHLSLARLEGAVRNCLLTRRAVDKGVSAGIPALMIEDNDIEAAVEQKLLEQIPDIDLDITRVSSLGQAVIELEAGKYDLVFSDLGLPDAPGLTAVQTLVQKFSHIPVIVISGTYDEKVMAERVLRAGAQDFIDKRNITINLLTRAVRNTLERQVLLKELRISQRNFLDIVENTPDGIVVVDAEGFIRHINASYSRLFQPPVGFEPGARYNGPLADGDAVEIGLTLASGEAGEAEVRVRRTHWVGEPAFLVTFRDITDVKRARQRERERQSVEAQARKMRAIANLVSGVTHEVNNSLSGVIGMADLLKRGLAEGDEVDVIARESARAARIIQELQSYTRVNLDDIRPVDLGQVIRGALEDARRQCRKADIRLSADGIGILPDVTADPGPLKHVFDIILENARDAAGPGGRIELTAEAGDGCVRIQIKDSGPGVPADILPTIFDPFVSTKPRDEGTGLGLSVAQGTLALFGGTICAENPPGGGALFTVSLPVAGGPRDVRSSREGAGHGAA